MKVHTWKTILSNKPGSCLPCCSEPYGVREPRRQENCDIDPSKPCYPLRTSKEQAPSPQTLNCPSLKEDPGPGDLAVSLMLPASSSWTRPQSRGKVAGACRPAHVHSLVLGRQVVEDVGDRDG